VSSQVRLCSAVEMAAQQQRFFEETHHATIYAAFRPKAPQKLADRIVQHLKTKVSTLF